MRTPKELWDAVMDICFDDFDLFAENKELEEGIALLDCSDEERAWLLNDLREQREFDEPVDPNAEDLKTYIPGVGFLVTNLGTGESHIFDIS